MRRRGLWRGQEMPLCKTRVGKGNEVSNRETKWADNGRDAKVGVCSGSSGSSSGSGRDAKVGVCSGSSGSGRDAEIGACSGSSMQQ